MKVGANTGGGDLVPAAAGWHHAVLAEEVDLGEQRKDFGKGLVTTHQGLWLFQVEERHPHDDSLGEDLRGRRKVVMVYWDARVGLGGVDNVKGTVLRRMIEGWRGKGPFSREDLLRYAPLDKGGQGQEFDTSPLVGRPAQILVNQETTRSGKLIAKLINMKPADAGKQLTVEDWIPYAQWKASARTSATAAHDEVSAAAAGEGDDDPMKW